MNNRDDASAKNFDALQSELERLRDDVATLTGTLKAIVGDLGPEAAARVERAAVRVRASVEDSAENVASLIEKRPFASVVVSFVIGLLFGLLFGRRM